MLASAAFQRWNLRQIHEKRLFERLDLKQYAIAEKLCLVFLIAKGISKKYYKTSVS